MPPSRSYNLDDPIDCLQFLADKMVQIHEVAKCAGILAMLPESLVSRDTSTGEKCGALMKVLHRRGARTWAQIWTGRWASVPRARCRW